MAEQSSQFSVSLDRVANSPVTEGIHIFTITGVTEDESEKGPYWKFDLHCETPGEETKSTAMFLSLTPQSRWRLELFFDAVQAPKAGSVTADKFIGRKFRAQVSHEDYNGRAQARIGEMWPVAQTGAAPKAARPQTPVATAVQAKAGAKTPKAAMPAGKGLPQDSGDTDEIPFSA